MKMLLASLVVLAGISGCISSSSPPAPQKTTTTVVVPADSGTVVVCSDGTHPPCN
jgi:ABC-type glycerol-3-phosphate transport system substrate-binding protein